MDFNQQTETGATMAAKAAPPLLALLPVAVAAVGKELWDSRTHPADWMDAVYTIAGGTFAFLWTLGVGMVNAA